MNRETKYAYMCTDAKLAPTGVVSENIYCEVKPNLDSNHTFPIDFGTKRNFFSRSKSIGKV